MATYNELITVLNDGDLSKRVSIALMISAHTVLQGTPTASDRSFAKLVFESPERASLPALRYLLAAENAQTLAAIQGVTDAAIQTRMDEAFPILAAAAAGA